MFQDALRQILIVFAKLNPGIRYVQGMNEVLAPLFYVFRNDPDKENAVSAIGMLLLTPFYVILYMVHILGCENRFFIIKIVC